MHGSLWLAAYTTEQRTKEIGIRKVLGASVASITSMLSKDFVRLVLIAIIIASPIAWFGSKKWLQDFAYRIDVNARSIFYGRNFSYNDCVGNCKSPGNKSSNCKSS
jgi:predicted lysophospholipase L1 biosynthesis ABC-type transport system permease subunit